MFFNIFENFVKLGFLVLHLNSYGSCHLKYWNRNEWFLDIWFWEMDILFLQIGIVFLWIGIPFQFQHCWFLNLMFSHTEMNNEDFSIPISWNGYWFHSEKGYSISFYPSIWSKLIWAGCDPDFLLWFIGTRKWKKGSTKTVVVRRRKKVSQQQGYLWEDWEKLWPAMILTRCCHLWERLR